MAARSRPFWPITTRRLARALAFAPGPVELVREARADALDEQPHRLAVDGDEALDAQDVVGLGGGLQAIHERLGLGDDRQLDDEALEVVMVVLLLAVVVRGAGREVVLGAGAEAEQDVGIDAALAGAHHLHGARHRPDDVASADGL